MQNFDQELDLDFPGNESGRLTSEGILVFHSRKHDDDIEEFIHFPKVHVGDGGW